MGPVVFIIERVKSGNYGAKIGKNDNLANNDYANNCGSPPQGFGGEYIY